jgi:hypothetical protein
MVAALRTYKVLEKNGSIFVKLGQHLAAMGYLLPLEWTVSYHLCLTIAVEIRAKYSLSARLRLFHFKTGVL